MNTIVFLLKSCADRDRKLPSFHFLVMVVVIRELRLRYRFVLSSCWYVRNLGTAYRDVKCDIVRFAVFTLRWSGSFVRVAIITG